MSLVLQDSKDRSTKGLDRFGLRNRHILAGTGQVLPLSCDGTLASLTVPCHVIH